jgi:hypothetical protein
MFAVNSEVGGCLRNTSGRYNLNLYIRDTDFIKVYWCEILLVVTS